MTGVTTNVTETSADDVGGCAWDVVLAHACNAARATGIMVQNVVLCIQAEQTALHAPRETGPRRILENTPV